MPRSLAFLIELVALVACSTSLRAQRPVDSTPSRQDAPRRRKDAPTAALISWVLPGGGHWYARENARGWIVFATYATSAAIVTNGRTDRAGKVAGIVAISSWLFGAIDGPLAVRRYNRHLPPSVRPHAAVDARGAMRLGIAVQR